MKKEVFIKKLYESIKKENINIYKNIFENTEISKVTDPYWKRALILYNELSDDSKGVLLEIINQTEIDAVSNMLGVFDGIVSVGECKFDFNITFKNNKEIINGNLQDLFLENDENII